MKLATYLIPFVGCFLCSSHTSRAAMQPINIALGKTVTLNTPSTESYTLDKNPAQLTDGKYAGEDFDAVNKSSTLWVQKGALTWRVRNSPIIITIDLGEVMPISGASYSTAAGGAGVEFPSLIGISVSNDAKLWHYEGNLVSLSRKNGEPKPSGYSKFRFVTHDLKIKGRYIAFVVKQTPYTVTDEIEVYAGDDSWVNLPESGPAFSSLDGFLTHLNIQHRVTADIQTVRQALAKSGLSTAAKSTFTTQLDKVTQDNEVFGQATKAIKTILPITDNHRSVMSIYGEILAAEGIAPLAIWHQNRYAWLPFITKPLADGKRDLNITMLKNELRSDALLLTNASGKEKIVALQLVNPPANAEDGWLKVDSVVWTDTYQGVPVTDALLPILKTDGGYLITIPAGFTGKVWFTVDASKVPSGDYKSIFTIDSQNVTFHLTVSKLVMQRPRMSLTMWDNADSVSLTNGVSRGITPQNKAAALAMMKSHFVDAPWADRELLPWPKADDFNAQNELTADLNFSGFDGWVAEWPQARIFFVFLHIKENDTFAGAKRGTPEFNARVGAYAKAFSAHLHDLNLRPNQVSFLIVDEPKSELQDEIIVDWARAIRAGSPQLSLVSDLAWGRPDLQKNQDAFSLMSILMPATRRYESSSGFYQQQRKDGRDLWMYDASGSVRLINPQHYYRGTAWRVFSIGGKGMGFWAFNDIGGAPTSWNGYQIPMDYSPAFLDKDTVYNSVHWDAVREGVEDFEVLAMLQDAIKSTTNIALKTKAQAVLDEATKAVTATGTIDLWSAEDTPELIDQQLKNVRGVLEELSVG